MRRLGGQRSESPHLPRTMVIRVNDRTVCRARVADNPWSRGRGLLGRAALSPGEGLWIMPCRSVHTVGMRFTIDVVYLDSARRIVKLCPQLSPFRASTGGRDATTVLELPAGTIAELGLQVGAVLDAMPEPAAAPA